MTFKKEVPSEISTKQRKSSMEKKAGNSSSKESNAVNATENLTTGDKDTVVQDKEKEKKPENSLSQEIEKATEDAQEAAPENAQEVSPEKSPQDANPDQEEVSKESSDIGETPL